MVDVKGKGKAKSKPGKLKRSISGANMGPTVERYTGWKISDGGTYDTRVEAKKVVARSHFLELFKTTPKPEDLDDNGEPEKRVSLFTEEIADRIINNAEDVERILKWMLHNDRNIAP